MGLQQRKNDQLPTLVVQAGPRGRAALGDVCGTVGGGRDEGWGMSARACRRPRRRPPDLLVVRRTAKRIGVPRLRRWAARHHFHDKWRKNMNFEIRYFM